VGFNLGPKKQAPLPPKPPKPAEPKKKSEPKPKVEKKPAAPPKPSAEAPPTNDFLFAILLLGESLPHLDKFAKYRMNSKEHGTTQGEQAADLVTRIRAFLNRFNSTKP